MVPRTLAKLPTRIVKADAWTEKACTSLSPIQSIWWCIYAKGYKIIFGSETKVYMPILGFFKLSLNGYPRTYCVQLINYSQWSWLNDSWFKFPLWWIKYKLWNLRNFTYNNSSWLRNDRAFITHCHLITDLIIDTIDYRLRLSIPLI